MQMIEGSLRVDGKRVFVMSDHPKYQLPNDVCVPAKYRIEFNRWALNFFGTHNVIPDGSVYTSLTQGSVWMNPRTYQNLLNRMMSQPQ